jgi:hypothetical protein
MIAPMTAETRLQTGETIMRHMSHVAAATMISGLLADDICHALLDAPAVPAKRPAQPSDHAGGSAAPTATPRSNRPLSDLIRMLDTAI